MKDNENIKPYLYLGFAYSEAEEARASQIRALPKGAERTLQIELFQQECRRPFPEWTGVRLGHLISELALSKLPRRSFFELSQA